MWLETAFTYGMIRSSQLWEAFLGVASTHIASRSEARNGVSLFSDPLVSLGPDPGGGGGALDVLIPAAPVCSQGAETDYNNTFYWVNFINFEIKEETKRPHDHHPKSCNGEVIAQFG